MFEKCRYKWEYIPVHEKETGYQQLVRNLALPQQPEIFKNFSIEEKQKIVDQIIKNIRFINIFPIYYFNKQGIYKEILSVINKNNVCFNEDDNLQTQAVQGSLLLDYLFPNLHHVIAGYKKNPSIYQIFYNDENLKRCLISFLQQRKLLNLRTAFFSRARYIWNAGTNFLPMRAKAIYERFCPKNGIVYDYSAGFGGRMLGALSSKNNYTYIAVEPNSDTYYNLLQLGTLIEDITKRKNSFQIYHTGSENFIPNTLIDFAFSCPPFFDLEKYSDEETQSIIKYPNYNDWLENYVRPTIKNCYKGLKENGIFAVDLMNYFKHSVKIPLIEDWLRIAEEQGFYLRKVCKIITRARKKNEEDKQQLLIFTKNKNIIIKNEISLETKQQYNQKIQQLKHQKQLKKKTYCRYNLYGQLEDSFESIEKMQKTIPTYSIEEIKSAIKSKKRYKQYIFKIYKGTEIILKTIPIKKVICKIDNEYFDTFAAAGRYLNVSRQAVQQAYQRKSKIINNKQL